jgi:hypothetical protein
VLTLGKAQINLALLSAYSYLCNHGESGAASLMMAGVPEQFPAGLLLLLKNGI